MQSWTYFPVDKAQLLCVELEKHYFLLTTLSEEYMFGFYFKNLRMKKN